MNQFVCCTIYISTSTADVACALFRGQVGVPAAAETLAHLAPAPPRKQDSVPGFYAHGDEVAREGVDASWSCSDYQAFAWDVLCLPCQ